MPRRFARLSGTIAVLATLVAASAIRDAAVPSASPEQTSDRTQFDPPRRGARALAFERNDGQADPAARFLARAPGGVSFVMDDGAVLAPRGGGPLVRMRFVGGSAQSRAHGAAPREGVVHYIKGRDPARWLHDVPTYAEVVVRGAWPGVDVVFHGGAEGLEYDLLVAPGASLAPVALSFEGEKPRTDARGDLVAGTVRFGRPRVFEGAGAAQRELRCEYSLADDGRVGFDVAGRDSTQPLLIDPVIAFATYLGGSSGESANDLVVDASGDVLVTGSTGSVDFPLEAALIGGAGPGSVDAYVTKLDPSGSRLVFSTYFGGNAQDAGWGIRTSPAGVWVAGSTASPDFPTVAPLQRDLVGGVVEGDAFLVKINARGSSVVFSTYLGGAGEDGCRSLDVDSHGDAYLAGFTRFVGAPDFPVTSGAAQTVRRGATDAWAARIDAAGSRLIWSGFLGGNGTNGETVEEVVSDGAGGAFVGGYTDSNDFPTTPGALQTAYGGGNTDAFVAHLDASGGLASSTYLGGSEDDVGRRVARDGAGRVYVAGFTRSPNFPVAAALRPAGGAGAATGDAFVAELEPSLDRLVFSTYLGGAGDETADGLAVSASGDVLVAGGTTSILFQPAASGALRGVRDGFVVRLAPGGASLLSALYLGGAGDDAATALAVDARGDAYAALSTTSSDLATPCGVLSSRAGGPQDVFLVKLAEDAPGAPATPDGLAAEAVSAHRIDVSWIDTSGTECGLRLERAVTGLLAPYAALPSGTTSFVDADVEPDRTYRYAVVAVNPSGDSAATDEVAVTTPQTLAVRQIEGGIVDASKLHRDVARLALEFRFNVSSDDDAFDPSTESLHLEIGEPSDPFVFDIPAGDPRWKVKRGRHVLVARGKGLPKVKIDVDLRGDAFHAMRIAASRFDYPTAPGSTVRLAVRAGDDAGHADTAWRTGKKAGRLSLP